MFEIIFFVAIGAIVYSAVQSTRRGNVSLEERKLNPTLIESANEWADELERKARKFRYQAEFEVGYCGWFGQFEQTISEMLELAEKEAKRGLELGVDLKISKLNDEIRANHSNKAEVKKPEADSKTVFVLASQTLPVEPPPNNDPELDEIFKRIYWEKYDQHKKFLQDVYSVLKRNPKCKKYFFQHLRDLNLSSILRGYFLNDEALRNIAADTDCTSAVSKLTSEALCMARFVGDPFARTRALLNVAEGQVQIGDLSSARDTTAEALEAARADPSGQVSNLEKASKVQISLGDVSEALETAYRIEDNLRRAKVLVDISSAQAALGDVSCAQITALSALQETRKVAAPEDRCSLLQQVANALARAHDGPTANIAIYEALNSALDTKKFVVIDPELPRLAHPARAAAMAAVAEVQAANGDICGALETTKSITNQYQSQTDEVNFYFATTLSEGARQEALVRIVEICAETGDVSRAHEIARSIEIAGKRVWALAHVATAQAVAGHLSESRNTVSEALLAAREIFGRGDSQLALVYLVEQQAEVGDVLGALHSARTIRDGEARCQALVSVASRQVCAGDQSGARLTASEELAAARSVYPIYSIPGALGQVGRAYAEAEDFPSALMVVRAIGSAAHRCSLLAKIARIQLDRGNIEDAHPIINETIEAARSPHGTLELLRTESFCTAAELQVMIGDEGALQTALDAGNELQVAYALERVAKTYAEAGHLAKAIEIVLRIEDLQNRSNATISIAVAYNDRHERAAFNRGGTAEPTAPEPNNSPITPSASEAVSDVNCNEASIEQVQATTNSKIIPAIGRHTRYATVKTEHKRNGVVVQKPSEGKAATREAVPNLAGSTLMWPGRRLAGFSDAEMERRLKALQAAKAREVEETAHRKAMAKVSAEYGLIAQMRETDANRIKEHEASEPELLNVQEIRAEAENRRIPHLVHFTRCENLHSILKHGLLSVSSCSKQGIGTVRNDIMRLDGKPECISLSVTFPNYRMFYKYRQAEPTADWAVLLLPVKILWEKDCIFLKNNAADARMRKVTRKQSGTALALREMFENSDRPRQKWLRPYDPTDPQAEIMVFNAIEPNLIETVAFETKDVAEKWKGVLGEIDTINAGKGEGLFGSREKLRGN